MHATMIFPHLMLFKTKSESDGSNSKTIARRFKQWHKGELDELFNEGKALQICLSKSKKKKVETEARQFNKLKCTRKIYSAFAKLADTSKGVLSLEENVKGQTVLMSRASKQQLLTSCSEDTIPFHSSTFDQKNAQKYMKAAMTTHGSHGHSGLDANEWRTITKCLKSEFVVLGSN